MKLTIIDRLNLSQMLPNEGSLSEQMVLRDIRKKLEISVEELESIEYKALDDKFQFNSEKALALSNEYEFTSAELQSLKGLVSSLDEKKKITSSILDLCLLIKNAEKA